MSDQPALGTAGPRDPFTDIHKKLISFFLYLFNRITATCDGRSAYRMTDPHSREYLAYLLANAEGAAAAAVDFQRYRDEYPPPVTQVEFKQALLRGRELAAAAKIPFPDADTVFREALNLFDRLDSMTVSPPPLDIDLDLGVGSGLTAPDSMNGVLADEIAAWYMLYDRLKAFRAHASGVGLLPKAEGAAEEKAKRDVMTDSHTAGLLSR